MPTDITVNLPDGSKAHFPLGTSPDVMSKALTRYKTQSQMPDPQTSPLSAPARLLTEATVGDPYAKPTPVPAEPSAVEKLASHLNIGPLKPGEAMIRSGRQFASGQYASGIGSGVSAILQTLAPLEAARAGRFAYREFIPKDKAVALDRLATGLEKGGVPTEDLVNPRTVMIEGKPTTMSSLELATHEMAPTARQMGVDLGTIRPGKGGLDRQPEVIRKAFDNATATERQLLTPILNKPFDVQGTIATAGTGDTTLTNYHRQTGRDTFTDAKKILSKETLDLINRAKTVQDARDVESLIDYDLRNFYNSRPGGRKALNARMEVRAARAIRKDINSKIDAMAPGLDVTTQTIAGLMDLAETVGTGEGGAGLAAQLRIERATPVLSRVPSYPMAAGFMGKAYGLVRAPMDIARGGPLMRSNRIVNNAWRYLKNEESLLPKVVGPGPGPATAEGRAGTPTPPVAPTAAPPAAPPRPAPAPPGVPTSAPDARPPLAGSQVIESKASARAVKPQEAQGASVKAAKAKEPAAVSKEALKGAIRQGEVDPSGSYYSLPGSSTYHDPQAVTEGRATVHDLSSKNIANTEHIGTTVKILSEALKTPDLTTEQKTRLVDLLKEAKSGEPHINYRDNDELPIPQAAKKLGYDGIVVWENDDWTKPSSVFAWEKGGASKTSEGFVTNILGKDRTILSAEEAAGPKAKSTAIANAQKFAQEEFAAAREAAPHGEVPNVVLNKIIKEFSKVYKHINETYKDEEVKPKVGRPTKEEAASTTPAERALEARKREAQKLKEDRQSGKIGSIVYGEKAMSAAERLRAGIAKSGKKPDANFGRKGE